MNETAELWVVAIGATLFFAVLLATWRSWCECEEPEPPAPLTPEQSQRAALAALEPPVAAAVLPRALPVRAGQGVGAPGVRDLPGGAPGRRGVQRGAPVPARVPRRLRRPRGRGAKVAARCAVQGEDRAGIRRRRRRGHGVANPTPSPTRLLQGQILVLVCA